MKILHVNCNYITTALHQKMIEELDRQGVDNTVFVPTYDKSKSTIQVRNNVIVSQCFKKFYRYNFDLKQNCIIKSLERNVCVNDYDCIHAYTLFTDGNCAMKLAQKSGKPFVVAVRNTDVNEFFKKRLLLRKRGVKILRKASAVFFLSNKYKEEVFAKYLPSKYRSEIEKKSFVIPNGIDDFWYRNINLPKSIESKDIVKVGKILFPAPYALKRAFAKQFFNDRNRLIVRLI